MSHPVPVLALLLASALPAAAARQAPPEARVDAAVWTAVEPVLSAARRDSLPIDALRSKVFEGAAKGVAPERIRVVVQEMADDFRSVRNALRGAGARAAGDAAAGAPVPAPAPAPGEVVAAAMAVRQGIPLDAVLRLWRARPDGVAGSLEVPLVVLTEIVRRGVDVPQAEALMGTVVANRVPAHVAAQLPGRLDGALAAGTPPGQALDAAVRALNLPRPPGRNPGRRPIR
ncbi:MAG: hypothetical protein RQ751_13850 [Longimicrobiales bacterium]|nr:hypothetical protein [Longimicrobiales bacterium]